LPPETNADFFGGTLPSLAFYSWIFLHRRRVCKQRKCVFVYALFSHIGEVIFIICKTVNL
jgi:hypothetical protein